MNLKLIRTGAALALLSFSMAAFAAEKKTESKPPKPYPLDTCAVSEEKLGDMGDPYVFVHNGQEVKLCCKECLGEFKKNTAKYTKLIEEANKKVKPYPLKNCVVSDEAFGGDMGDPYVFVHAGREIKLCCKSCLKDFNKDPKKYVALLEKADKAAKKQ